MLTRAWAFSYVNNVIILANRPFSSKIQNGIGHLQKEMMMTIIEFLESAKKRRKQREIARKMTPGQFRAARARGELSLLTNETLCSVCGKPIQEHSDEMYEIRNGLVCQNCYYKELGGFIAKHPIGTPELYPHTTLPRLQ